MVPESPDSTGRSPCLPALDLVDRPDTGRVFTSTRRIRWGDTDPAGRLRLDAAARHLQDNSNDDTRDAGLDPTEPWVVRRTAFRIDVAPTVGCIATLTTWNSGQGRRWAERRTTISTDAGGRIEAASLWVRIDRDTGLPARLTPEFHAVYDEAAAGRRVGSRLRLPEPPDPPNRRSRPWPLRHTDLDGLGHVNNAATWEPIVDEAARCGLTITYAELEYGDGIGPDDDVELVARHADDGGAASDEIDETRETGETGGSGEAEHESMIWLLVDGRVRATALVRGHR